MKTTIAMIVALLAVLVAFAGCSESDMTVGEVMTAAQSDEEKNEIAAQQELESMIQKSVEEKLEAYDYATVTCQSISGDLEWRCFIETHGDDFPMRAVVRATCTDATCIWNQE